MGMLCVIVLCLSACILPGGAAPVLKVGLIEPFEGLGRPLGYAVLPAVQEVLDSANASGELGSYRLLLVALNDDLDPAAAAAQAAALAQDASVIAVIGPFTIPTAAQAAPILSAARIPALVAAPLGQTMSGIVPMCPDAAATAGEVEKVSCSDNATDQISVVCSQNRQRQSLSEAEFGTAGGAAEPVRWSTDAATAAAWLASEPTNGSGDRVTGGPDVLKPWFMELAGEAGEGTRAVACSLTPRAAVPGELPEVALARAAAERIVQAMAARVQAGVEPTRAEIVTELHAQQFEPGLVWYQVRDGAWQPLAEP